MVERHGDGGDRPASAGASATPLRRPGSLPRPSLTAGKRRTPRQDNSLLGKIETAFLKLPDAYPYLRVDGAAIGCGLPATRVTPDEARTALIDQATGYDDKDQGWRHLVAQARDAGTDWQLVATATALPGIKRRIREKGIVRDEDIDAEIVCQFLTRLQEIDRQPRNVCGRLIDSTVQRYVRQAVRDSQPVHDDPSSDDIAASSIDSGLDQAIDVLARLRTGGRITRDEARVVAYTRVVGLTLKQTAD
jgi:hypothetical protein